MFPSRVPIHPDEDATPHVRAAQASPEAEASAAAASIEMVKRTRKEYLEKMQRITRVPPVSFPWWRRLLFLGPPPAAVGQPLLPEQIEKLHKSKLGHFQELALGRELATHCLGVYNSSHPDNEYEPAPGEVIQSFRFNNSTLWIHGNFVARRKPSGWISFLLSFLLPAPRTLFFFEISKSSVSRDVVTCTPLDEPVTEAYSILGFPLGFSKRRSGKLDTICKTCSCRIYLPHTGIHRKPQCGHDNTHRICVMCYYQSDVLHPNVFKFGIPDP